MKVETEEYFDLEKSLKKRDVAAIGDNEIALDDYGVETKEEFDYLVGLGADLFQGYYLARPA